MGSSSGLLPVSKTQTGVEMTVERGFIITIISGLVFAAFGAALGYGIGTFAPDYYRIVLRVPPEMRFDTAQAGLGLGLTQGVAVGLVIGLVIVVAVAWYESRLAERSF